MLVNHMKLQNNYASLSSPEFWRNLNRWVIADKGGGDDDIIWHV